MRLRLPQVPPEQDWHRWAIELTRALSTQVTEDDLGGGGGGGSDFLSPGATGTDFWELDGGGFGKLAIGNNTVVLDSILGTVGRISANSSAFFDSLLLSPSLSATSDGSTHFSRGLLIDYFPFDAITLDDISFFALNVFSQNGYDINLTTPRVFVLLNGQGDLRIHDTGLTYVAAAGTHHLIGDDGVNLFGVHLFIDELHQIADAADYRLNDHIDLFSSPTLVTTNGGSLTIDLLEPIYSTRLINEDENVTIYTERGAHFRSPYRGTPVEHRAFVGVEIDERSNAEYQWSLKSDGLAARFLSRGQAIYGAVPIASATIESLPGEGDSHIDVISAAPLTSSGYIRAGYNQLADDRYYKYSSITLGGGTLGGDRINLDQSISFNFTDAQDVLQYAEPQAQVDIYIGDVDRVGLKIFAEQSGAQAANLLELLDQNLDVLFGVGNTGYAIFAEATANPPDPDIDDAAHVYKYDHKLIIQFNDGGTVRYKYLDLTGTGVTWTHTTTPP